MKKFVLPLIYLFLSSNFSFGGEKPILEASGVVRNNNGLEVNLQVDFSGNKPSINWGGTEIELKKGQVMQSFPLLTEGKFTTFFGFVLEQQLVTVNLTQTVGDETFTNIPTFIREGIYPCPSEKNIIGWGRFNGNQSLSLEAQDFCIYSE